jgi:hypothetical protein
LDAAPFHLNMFTRQVKKIVTGIRNSIKAVSNLIMLKVDKASVMECPMVKLVTSASTFFQSPSV